MASTLNANSRVTGEGIKSLHDRLATLLTEFRGVSLVARQDADELTRIGNEYRNTLEQLIEDLTNLRERMGREKVFDFGRLEHAVKTAEESARRLGEQADRFHSRPFADIGLQPADAQPGLVEALAESLRPPRLKGEDASDEEPMPRFLSQSKGSEPASGRMSHAGSSRN